MSSEGMQILSEAEAQEMIHIGPPFRLTHGGFGLELSGGTPPLEAFGRAMIYVKSHMDRGRYLLGDLANLAEANHGENLYHKPCHRPERTPHEVEYQ